MNTIVKKPWGSFEIINEGKKHIVKKIIVKPEGQLSLQSHKHRSEHWVIVEGIAEIVVNDEIFNLHENQHIFIPKGTKHRIFNEEKETLEIIELQYGDLISEEDIKRFKDLYNRD